jgi:hypothetical protein
MPDGGRPGDTSARRRWQVHRKILEWTNAFAQQEW